jgi:membrane-bound lytic murein transglycosylase A
LERDSDGRAVARIDLTVHHPVFVLSRAAITPRLNRWLLVSALSLAVASSCATLQPADSAEPRLVALSFEECVASLRDDGSTESLQQALARSEEYLARLPPEREVNVLDRKVSAAALFGIVHVALEALSGGRPLETELCTRFRLYRVELPSGLLVTGYYEPEIEASRVRSERFRFPLYGVPPDLVSVDLGAFCEPCAGRSAYARVRDYELVPYYTRAEIDAGALQGKEAEIVWLDDPIDVFFLHIQGSARLRFDDGTQMQVSYAGSNDRPYTSIGRMLVAQGKMSREEASLQNLESYLRSHPQEQAAIMAANQRYIFFRTVPAGPVGSIGAVLTPGRSIAADRRAYPPGALTFLRIDERGKGGQPPVYARFALIQDAGIAIDGPERLDTFWGTGVEGERLAGDMRNPGELLIILPD